MIYLTWKLIHIISVIMFLGNISMGLYWAARAHKSHDFKLISVTFQNIIKSDRYFTVPGVIGIIIAGFAAAINGRIPILSTGWIFWSIILFIVSGVIFSIYLGPLQRKIFNLTQTESSANNWSTYERLYKQWELWGFFALITPLAAVVLMVLKPFLPGI